MLPLGDPRWKTLTGGYRVPYDASQPLQMLFDQGASDELWDELWQELHHQGDVGPASYAAVPHLLEFARRSLKMDWNVFGLIATIELERPSNPDVPPFLADGYFQAIDRLPEIVGAHRHHLWDDLLASSIFSCVALARGQRVLARVYLEMDIAAAKKWMRDEFGLNEDEL